MRINPDHVATVADWLEGERSKRRSERTTLADIVLSSHAFSHKSFYYLSLCGSPDHVRSLCTALGLALSDGVPDVSEIHDLVDGGWIERIGQRYAVKDKRLTEFVQLLNQLQVPEAVSA